MKNNDDVAASRRRLLAAAGGSVVAAGLLPDTWTKPVVNAVLLPAHAQATGENTIDCSVSDPATDCGSDAISFTVSGSVSSGDGSSLAGVMLEVEYTNELDPSGDTASVFFQVTVQGDGTFDGTFTAVPPSGGWADPEGTVTVRFQDQATYGNAECSEVYSCASGADDDIVGDDLTN